MAKTATRPIGNAKSLLTAAEKKVLDSTIGEPLAAASQEQLEALRKHARTLRDKWRDLFSRQTIATKRTPVRNNTAANNRSREKSDLFGDAITRVEARLAELSTATSTTIGGTKRGTKSKRTSAARTVTKPTRQAGHRATRATIRGELSEAVSKMNEAAQTLAGKASGKKKPTRVKAKASTAPSKRGAKPEATPATEAVVVKAVPRGKKASRKPVKSKKARQAGKLRALAAEGTGQPLSFDAKKQRTVSARLKSARIKLDGQLTRRKGFVMTSGKRKQARRDSR